MKNRMTLLTILISILGCAHMDRYAREKPADLLIFEAVDPLEKIFIETAFFPKYQALAEVARGEHATFQFAFRCSKPVLNLQAEVEEIRSGTDLLREVSIGYIGYLRIGRTTPNPSRDRLFSLSGYYPDPILEYAPEVLPPYTTQPVWVSVAIQPGAEPGIYKGQITLKGKIEDEIFELSKGFTIRVYPVTVKKTSLWVTNWYTLDAEILGFMNGGTEVKPYSDRYWEFVRVLARKMADYRQNVALISPLRLTEYTYENGKYSLDFSRFDRTVQIFKEEGVIGRIEGGHIGTRESNWTSNFVVFVPEVRPDTVEFVKHPVASEQAQTFYYQFIPALMAHLDKKGWSDIYMQHLADEPIEENIDSYVEIARLIKELTPGLKVIEACHSRNLDKTVDVWVPQLNFLDEDYEFYRGRQEANDEVWFYTCLAPQGEYANRFIELPLLKTRILHWINYRYEIPGYLHWGFNFWRGNPYDESTSIITESGNVLPGGDCWIVYPGTGKLLSSIRLEAMRDGLVDYELLRMLEEKIPEQTKELTRQVVYNFTRYDMNIAAFRAKRRQILELLSAPSNED